MLTIPKEKLNEAIMMLNKNLQEINIQNMDTELVAQMFKNYQSNEYSWCAICISRGTAKARIQPELWRQGAEWSG